MDELIPGYREIARGALVIAAAVYLLFAVLHVLTQPPALALPMFATAGATALLFLTLRIAFDRGVLAQAQLNFVMLAIMFGAGVNSTMHLALSGEAMQSTNLAMVLLASGIALVGVAEFAGVVAACWLAWTACAVALAGDGGNWFHYAVNIAEATVLACLTFAWKRTVLIRNFELNQHERHADAALRENEERFRTIFALAPVGIVVNRMEDGRYLAASKALLEMVGYTEEEFAALTYWDITPREYGPDEARQLELLRTIGRFGPYEKEYIRKDGTRVPILLHGRKLVDASGTELILAVVQDISAQKATQQALAAARDAAEAANVAKSRFLATMSHELRTPLNAILGFSELIARETFGPAGNKQYVEYAEIIHTSGAHLLSLISDILDLSKIEAGKLELRHEALDLHDVVCESFRLVGAKRQANRAAAVPEMKLPANLPQLHADRRATVQMIVNLVSNAVKFTPAQGKVTVEAHVDAHGEMIVAVTDTGIGIAKADIAKALAPFSQIDDGAARKQEGTGLGLPIVKSLIELHGGRFTLESDAGQGTRATLIFPKDCVITPPQAVNA